MSDYGETLSLTTSYGNPQPKNSAINLSPHRTPFSSPSPDSFIGIPGVIESHEAESRGSLWHLELQISDFPILVEDVFKILLLHVHGEVSNVEARHGRAVGKGSYMFPWRLIADSGNCTFDFSCDNGRVDGGGYKTRHLTLWV